MSAFTKSDLESVINGMMTDARLELKEMINPSGLERFWYFAYDSDRSVEWNIYLFVDMLDLYKRKCRQWEEMHNGSMCVVERVRDKYLRPKITEFAETIGARKPGSVRLPNSRGEAEMMLLVAERYLRDNGFIAPEL